MHRGVSSVRRTERSTSTAAIAAVAMFVVVAVGCSGGGATSEPAGATTDAAVEATDTTLAATTTGTAAATTSAPTGSAATTEPAPTTPTTAAPTFATVPEDGVPGIESDDAFCRAWGEFAGSFQALVLVASVGTDPVGAARLEVVAAPSVTSAAGALDETFPEAIEGERATFVDGVIGPFTRRAESAAEALVSAGLTNAELAELGELWLDALVDAGVDDPDLDVVVPDRLIDEVDTAVGEFVAAIPAIADDPSLVTTAAAPATFGYLADNCPDQGVLGGNDAID